MILSENHASILLSMDSWELFTPFSDSCFLTNASMAKKNITIHNDYEILVGLEGVYPYYFNGHCYNCRPGSIFLISPMLEHESFYTENSNILTHMWIGITDTFSWATVYRINAGKMKKLYSCKVSYENYMPEIKIYEVWNSLITAKKITPQQLFKLKLAICHLFLAIINNRQLSINEYQVEIMQHARNYIKEHFRQEINLGHLARKMGYSKFHFTRLFKEYYTVTVQEYIDQYRIKEVEKLLSKNIPKKEVAFQLGFSSPSAFSNWYKKYRPESNVASFLSEIEI